MSRLFSTSLLRSAITAGLGILIASSAFAQDYQLVWSDEFDGSSVDTGKWTFQIGTGCPDLCSWGNNELQYYRSQNASVSGGFLTITAREESWGGRDYTSARLNTRTKGDWTYGRFEMRAKLPVGRGLWPAFWMLFTDPDYGGWAASGEIDIMEYIGQNPDEVFGTIHFGGSFPNNLYSGYDYTLPSGTFDEDFHTFTLEWEPGELRWYVDGSLYACQYDWYSTGGEYPAPFDRDFHILLNLAVGGNLPGSPDGNTSFPQEYVIDYVRVYQKPTFPGCRIVFAGMDHANPYGNGWFIFAGIADGGIGANTSSVAPVDGHLASLEVGGGSGGNPGFFGGFGRWNPRDLTDMTHFSFWIDPDPGQDYTLVVQLQDDDNGDDSIPLTPDGADDEFETNVVVDSGGGDVIVGGGWQKVSIPLADLVDDNSYHWGGNGIFDPVSTGNGGNGRLVNVVVSIVSNSGADVTFRTDRWEFTREEGSIEGIVWADGNGNGLREGGEPGISGIPVRLRDEFLNEIAVTPTGGDGAYSFGPLPAGMFRVEVESTGDLSGATPTGDPDGVSTPNEAWGAVDCSGLLADHDFGYQEEPIAVPDGVGAAGPGLRAGFPNPFSASTNISFTLELAGPVKLAVFDMTGRRVRSLLRGEFAPGPYEVVWDGLDDSGQEVAGGIYMVSLVTPEIQSVQRLVRIP